MWFPLGAAFRICRPGTILNGDTEKTLPAYDAIIAEVHHSNHRLEVQKTTLSVVPDPRWFKGSGHPKSLQAVPLSNQGASLTFQIQPTTNGLLRFVLTLKAEARDVWREVEHRWTNLTPFLFTFFADGKAVRPKGPDSWGKVGGMNWMMKVVKQGKSYRWNLEVDPNSILSLLPDTKFKNLAIVAAFSEYQHEYPHMSSKPISISMGPGGFQGPPIVIRSNTVEMEFNEKKLKMKDDR